VRHVLSTRFGIVYCRERVRQILQALGCRWRRWRHWPLKAQPVAPAAFRTEMSTLLVIHARAEQHTGLPVEALGQDAERRRVLTPQPADSPELHPEERL
jgi:hypothetical protein